MNLIGKLSLAGGTTALALAPAIQPAQGRFANHQPQYKPRTPIAGSSTTSSLQAASRSTSR